jgi:hypothetical protein
VIALAIAFTIASMISGHPTQIACDVPTTAVVEAWTTPRSNLLHMQPTLCAGLGMAPGDPRFSYALGVLIHESSHARGVLREACAEMYADVLIYQVLRDYYRVPFFSKLSMQIGAQVLYFSRHRPAEYQWSTTSCDREP